MFSEIYFCVALICHMLGLLLSLGLLLQLDVLSNMISKEVKVSVVYHSFHYLLLSHDQINSSEVSYVKFSFLLLYFSMLDHLNTET